MGQRWVVDGWHGSDGDGTIALRAKHGKGVEKVDFCVGMEI